MANREQVKQRREWVENYVNRNKPTSLFQIAEMAKAAAIQALPENDESKVYYTIRKDVDHLREAGRLQEGDIAHNATIKATRGAVRLS